MTDVTSTPDAEYAARVAEQIRQYAQGFESFGLPAAYFFWSENFLRPGILDVYGPIDLNDFYARPFLEGAKGAARPRFLSIGCGDGSNEISLARRLLERGLTDFEFVLADLSPSLLERCRSNLDETLAPLFTLREVDLNRMDTEIEGEFYGVMASHSLHHLVELERIFGWVKRVLKPGCVFAINDMIGRNGHMRWPETAKVIQMIWPLLDDRQRYHAQFKRLFARFEDHDCSVAGFEGVRAQDILGLLTKTFHPRRFLAAGGVVDPFIERGFGFGFDLSQDGDRRILRFICELNDALLDNGQIKPTLMLAHFYVEPGEQKFYRARSAAASIRHPGIHPVWTDYYPPTPMLK